MTADDRDRAADERDRGAEDRDVVTEGLRVAASQQAERDRADSATDREEAAADRHVAARERGDALQDRTDASAAAERALETLEAMSDAFYTLDSEWRFTYVNPQAERILDRRGADLLGTAIWDVYPNAVGTNLDDAFRKAISEQESVRFEISDASDGRTYEVRAHPIPGGLATYFTDVTTERVRDEQHRQAQRLETLGRVTAGVAHDFNNLLTVISGYATLGRQMSEGRETASHYFEAIDAASQKAAALTQQLLTFGRAQPFSPAPLDLNSAIEDLTGILSQLLPPSVALEVAYAPEPVVVLIDRSQLEQVLVNLVVNSRDAIEGSGTVTLRTMTSAPEIPDAAPPCGCLEVADDGAGIAHDVLPHIFDPYFTTKPPEIGTGLGLATVYGIVMQSGGAISVDSTVDVGTTFTVSFPRTPTDVAS